MLSKMRATNSGEPKIWLKSGIFPIAGFFGLFFGGHSKTQEIYDSLL